MSRPQYSRILPLQAASAPQGPLPPRVRRAIHYGRARAIDSVPSRLDIDPPSIASEGLLSAIVGRSIDSIDSSSPSVTSGILGEPILPQLLELEEETAKSDSPPAVRQRSSATYSGEELKIDLGVTASYGSSSERSRRKIALASNHLSTRVKAWHAEEFIQLIEKGGWAGFLEPGSCIKGFENLGLHKDNLKDKDEKIEHLKLCKEEDRALGLANASLASMLCDKGTWSAISTTLLTMTAVRVEGLDDMQDIILEKIKELTEAITTQQDVIAMEYYSIKLRDAVKEFSKDPYVDVEAEALSQRHGVAQRDFLKSGDFRQTAELISSENSLISKYNSRLNRSFPSTGSQDVNIYDLAGFLSDGFSLDQINIIFNSPEVLAQREISNRSLDLMQEVTTGQNGRSKLQDNNIKYAQATLDLIILKKIEWQSALNFFRKNLGAEGFEMQSEYESSLLGILAMLEPLEEVQRTLLATEVGLKEASADIEEEELSRRVSDIEKQKEYSLIAQSYKEVSEHYLLRKRNHGRVDLGDIDIEERIEAESEDEEEVTQAPKAEHDLEGVYKIKEFLSSCQEKEFLTPQECEEIIARTMPLDQAFQTKLLEVKAADNLSHNKLTDQAMAIKALHIDMTLKSIKSKLEEKNQTLVSEATQQVIRMSNTASLILGVQNIILEKEIGLFNFMKGRSEDIDGRIKVSMTESEIKNFKEDQKKIAGLRSNPLLKPLKKIVFAALKAVVDAPENSPAGPLVSQFKDGGFKEKLQRG